jgi:inosine triphosphate pyrophosphatase
MNLKSEIISFITGSQPKFEEASAIIPNIKKVEIDLPEIQELDQHKVIIAKLNAAKNCGLDNFLVEDTGLYLQALNFQLPGPFIKWFLQSIGLPGLEKLSEQENMAYAQTDIGFWSSKLTEPVFFRGQLKGQIVPIRGHGFGWDVIFQPEGEDRTLAEMPKDYKNQISHRGLAFKAFKDFCTK